MVIQVHEDQVVPLFNSDRAKREMLRIKCLNPFELRCADELSVQAISPAVITAAKHFPRAATLGGRSRAMTTDIVEATRFAVLVAHQQQRFAGQFHGEVIPGLDQLLAMSDYLPRAMKNLLSLALVYFRSEIEVGREGPGPRDIGIDAELI